MPLIAERVKDIVGKAKLGLFQAHAEDLRLKWIILREIPKARFQEDIRGAGPNEPPRRKRRSLFRASKLPPSNP